MEKMDVKIFLMFIVAENTGSVNITRWSRPKYGFCTKHKMRCLAGLTNLH